ncbi:hypothetical protein GCM10027344_24000 [Spelaeicoccus albus]
MCLLHYVSDGEPCKLSVARHCRRGLERLESPDTQRPFGPEVPAGRAAGGDSRGYGLLPDFLPESLPDLLLDF